MTLHALELTLSPDSDAAIRRQWGRLAEAGLPSQAHHPGPTNAPHLTLLSATSIDAATEAATIQALAPLLPIVMRLTGLVVFGRSRFTLAHHVPPAHLSAAIATASTTAPGPGDRPWVGHVTLARRLTGEQLGQAVTVLADLDPVDALVADGLRRWDPEIGTTRRLLPATE